MGGHTEEDVQGRAEEAHERIRPGSRNLPHNRLSRHPGELLLTHRLRPGCVVARQGHPHHRQQPPEPGCRKASGGVGAHLGDRAGKGVDDDHAHAARGQVLVGARSKAQAEERLGGRRGKEEKAVKS